MSDRLEPKQVQELPWATVDDQYEALLDAAAYGFSCGKAVNIDGDVRLIRVDPTTLFPSKP